MIETGIVFGLTAGLAWGTGDFLGGWNSRKLPSTTVAFWAQATSLLLLGAIVLATRPGWNGAAFGWGLLAGVFTGSGGVSLYRGLATGNASVVAPLSALGAVIPVGAAVVRGEPPEAMAWPGIGLALAGIVLVSIPGEGASFRSAAHMGPILMGLGAALGFGLFFVVVEQGTQTGAPEIVVVLGSRMGAAAFLGASALAGGIQRPGRMLPGLAALGVIEMTANGAFALASTRGNLAVISVLSSLYPVVTVALARLFTNERLTPARIGGATMALAGAALISAA